MKEAEGSTFVLITRLWQLGIAAISWANMSQRFVAIQRPAIMFMKTRGTSVSSMFLSIDDTAVEGNTSTSFAVSSTNGSESSPMLLFR
jgi:hypothetical protein